MKKLLEQIMQQLRENVTELRWIDINLGQMDTETPPVDYPCALVDITNIDWSSTTGGKQVGKATVEVELYFIVRQPTNMTAPESIRAQGMEHFDTAHHVHEALKGLRGDSFGPLQRVNSKRKKEYYPRPIILAYACSVYD